jgi:predicted Co/Zn/Cd cation transporter (cation efflux family)
MSAGLPGLGLGGLFFVITALLGPFAELARTVRGQGSVAAWRWRLREFALALAMIVVFELVRRAVSGLISGGLELRSVAVTAIVLATVLTAAKLAELVLVLRRRVSRRRSALALRRYGPAPRLQPDPEG